MITKPVKLTDDNCVLLILLTAAYVASYAFGLPKLALSALVVLAAYTAYYFIQNLRSPFFQLVPYLIICVSSLTHIGQFFLGRLAFAAVLVFTVGLLGLVYSSVMLLREGGLRVNAVAYFPIALASSTVVTLITDW